MIEFSKEHSVAWLELMNVYQEFRAKIFHWAKENDDVKFHDLYIELSTPVFERDLHKRLLVMDFLRNTDMWDKKAILSVCGELTTIALQEQDEVAAYAREILKKLKHCTERIDIANKVFILASVEAKKEVPDYTLFHNGCMLLHDLGCKEKLEQFVREYKELIYLAFGLNDTDLRELIERT